VLSTRGAHPRHAPRLPRVVRGYWISAPVAAPAAPPMAAPRAGLPPVIAPRAAPPAAPIAPPLKARCCRGVMLAHPAVASSQTTQMSASARVIGSLPLMRGHMPPSCVHERAETAARTLESACRSFRQLAIMAQGGPTGAHVMGGPEVTGNDLESFTRASRRSPTGSASRRRSAPPGILLRVSRGVGRMPISLRPGTWPA
jgi:hypothetical protein